MEGIRVQVLAERYEYTARFSVLVCFESEDFSIDLYTYQLDTLLSLDEVGGDKVMVPFAYFLKNGSDTENIINQVVTALLAEAEVAITRSDDGIEVTVKMGHYAGSVVIEDPIVEQVVEL